jgi:branched-chain amino acid transport system ATP-binding protein
VNLLEVESVTRHFGGLAAVSDVSFHVAEGEILGLIGPNGAGKTTLFNLISAALKPKSGKISYDGADVTSLGPDRICRLGVARTFQTVKIFANIPVVRNVMVGSLFGTGQRISGSEALRRADEELEFVELARLRDVPAGDLTLASQKRLEVARALATRPRLLLLDEIMAGLTHTEVDEAMDLIKRIRSRTSCTPS